MRCLVNSFDFAQRSVLKATHTGSALKQPEESGRELPEEGGRKSRRVHTIHMKLIDLIQCAARLTINYTQSLGCISEGVRHVRLKLKKLRCRRRQSSPPEGARQRVHRFSVKINYPLLKFY